MTTWKLTLQDINTTPKELKTERDCSHRQLFRLFRWFALFAWFCPCFRFVLANYFIFSAKHQLDTWTLVPQKTRGMAWFCGCWEFRVRASNQSARIFFIRTFSGLRHTDEPQKGRNSCLSAVYNPAPFWVHSVSCWCFAELIFTKYDQHLQNLICQQPLSFLFFMTFGAGGGGWKILTKNIV